MISHGLPISVPAAALHAPMQTGSRRCWSLPVCSRSPFEETNLALVPCCRAAAVKLEVSSSLFLSVIGKWAQKACEEGPRALQMDIQADGTSFFRQGESLLIRRYAQLHCGLCRKSFPFSLCAKLRGHCSPRAGQSQPPPAAPGSEQTGEGASFMAGTCSQTECCVISHILWALSSQHPGVPMEAKGSLSLTTQQPNLGPWTQQVMLSLEVIKMYAQNGCPALKNQKCSSLSILTSLSGFMRRINPSLGLTPGTLMLSFFLHFLKTFLSSRPWASQLFLLSFPKCKQDQQHFLTLEGCCGGGYSRASEVHGWCGNGTPPGLLHEQVVLHTSDHKISSKGGIKELWVMNALQAQTFGVSLSGKAVLF